MKKKKKVILLVDDDRSMFFALQMVFPESYRLLYCDSVSCAKTFFKKNKKIDLIILDLVMPKESGLKLLEIMREMNVDIKVIVLSVTDTAKAAAEALKKGAVDYITKPFDVTELLAKVNKALS